MHLLRHARASGRRAQLLFIGKKIMNKIMIATCGINCNLCYANQRKKNRCLGCNYPDNTNQPTHCRTCSIKFCKLLDNAKKHYCYSCEKYPCLRIRKLDRRYREKYSVSMIENLNTIKIEGIVKFMKKEEKKWKCKICDNWICVHTKNCQYCVSLKS
jgi:hypothetical protein